MSIQTKILECISALLTMRVHHIWGEDTSYKSACHEVRQNKIRSSMPEMPKTLFLKKDFRVSGHYNIIDAEDIWTYHKNDDKDTINKCCSWLKSFKDRYTWKPSDDEMDALSNALGLAKSCGEESSYDLRTLYEHLKKLREE